MPRVEVLNGPPDELGKVLLLSDVLPRILAEGDFPYRFVSDSPYRRETFERILLEMAPHQCMARRVVGADQLVDEFAGTHQVGRCERMAIILQILAAEGKGHTTNRRGYLDALSDFVEALEASGNAQITALPVGADLVLPSALRLYATYRHTLRQRQLFSRWTGLSRFLEEVGNGSRVLPELELLVIDGRGHLPPLLRALYRQLGKSAQRVVFCLDMVGEWDIESGTASLPVDRIYGDYLGLAKELSAGRLNLRQGQVRPREEHRASGLFAGETGDKEDDHRFRVRSYPTIGMEIEGIAAQIRHLLSRGTDPGRILVAFADLKTHAATLKSVFSSFDLASRIHCPQPLLSVPLVGAALEILWATTSGLSRGALQRALFSPYVGFQHDGTVLCASEIDSWARRAAVANHRGEPWRAQWVAELRRWHKAGKGVESEFDFEQQIAVLSQALQRLSDYGRPCTLAEKSSQTLDLWRRFEIGAHLLAQSGPRDRSVDGGRGALSLYGRDIRAYAKLRRVVERLGASGSADVDGVQFLQMLQQILRRETLGDGPTFAQSGIDVIAFDALPVAAAEYLFVGGLGAGGKLWQPTVDTLLTERLVSVVPEMAGDLPRSSEDLSRAHYFLGALVRASQQTISLSYARNGLDAEDAVSPLLHELGRHFELRRRDIPVGAQALTGAICTAKRRQLHWARSGAAERVRLGKMGARALGLAPARLTRAIAIADERGRGVGAYCGQVGEDVGAGVFSAAAVHSVTALESYQRCPFAYFAQNVLALDPLDDGKGEAGAEFRGRMIHEILSEFHLRLLSEGGDLLLAPSAFPDGPGAWLKLAGLRLHQVAAPVIKRFTPARHDLFFEAFCQELLSGLVDQQRPGTLVAFLQKELTLLERCALSAVEMPFGIPEPKREGQLSIAEIEGIAALNVAGTIKVSGRIDRVDTLRANPEVIVVHDYKTGASVPTASDITEGRALQLPLYLLALQRAGRGVPGAAAYYRVSPGRGIEHRWAILDPALDLAARNTKQEPIADILVNSEAIIATAAAGARSGDFHFVQGCRRCQYVSLCRVEAPTRNLAAATSGQPI